MFAQNFLFSLIIGDKVVPLEDGQHFGKSCLSKLRPGIMLLCNRLLQFQPFYVFLFLWGCIIALYCFSFNSRSGQLFGGYSNCGKKKYLIKSFLEFYYFPFALKNYMLPLPFLSPSDGFCIFSFSYLT